MWELTLRVVSSELLRLYTAPKRRNLWELTHERSPTKPSPLEMWELLQISFEVLGQALNLNSM